VDNILFSDHYTEELDFPLDTVAQMQVLTEKVSSCREHCFYIMPMKLPSGLKPQNI